MPNTRQYRYLHKGDNEWLDDATNTDDKDWQEAWEALEEELKGMTIDITEEMYVNSEYGETPEWVNVEILDSGVLPFKMARGVLSALDGARGIVFTDHFNIDISEDWGGWSIPRLEVGVGGAFLTLCAKHSSEELEVNITEQFNQAIGEA
jgi:hypothetical protein